MNDKISQIEYRNGPNFVGLVIKTTLLTFITLGIYRFWQKARLRRHYWSAIHVKGDPLEYRGTGLEAFLGFLMVIVILAVYLGVVVTGLYFAGLVSMQDLVTVQIIGTFSLLPLIFFAQYRFRSYLASRTRWRGIRFGMEKGALGFMLWGIVYTLLGLITLGISGPFGRYKLDQYQTNRTWLGDYPFAQHGDWRQLYRYYAPYWASMLLIVCGAAIMLTADYELKDELGMSSPYMWETAAARQGLGLMILGYILSLVFMFYYMIRSNMYLLSQTLLNQEVGFAPSFSTRGVIGRYLLGSILASLVTYGVFIALAIVGWIVWLLFPNLDWEMLFQNKTFVNAVVIPSVIALYLAIILVFNMCMEIFLRAKIIEYIANRIGITNADALDQISQREGNDQLDADGLGQAFDVGFGF